MFHGKERMTRQSQNRASVLYAIERATILLAMTKYVKRDIAAKKLGMGIRTLHSRLREYGFSRYAKPRATWEDVELLQAMVDELKYVVGPTSRNGKEVAPAPPDESEVGRV